MDELPQVRLLRNRFSANLESLSENDILLRKTVYDKYDLHCCRPFDTYPDKAGDTTGPCENWYKGEDSSGFSKKSILIRSV